MKKILSLTALALLLSLTGCGDSAKETDKTAPASDAPQTEALKDYTVESAENKTERAEMLAVASAAIEADGVSKAKFNIFSLKAKGNFAFVIVDVSNPDGSEYKPENEHMDCCHAEALLRKDNGKWMSVAADAFSNDVWYACLWKEKNAPKEIFPATDKCDGSNGM